MKSNDAGKNRGNLNLETVVKEGLEGRSQFQKELLDESGMDFSAGFRNRNIESILEDESDSTEDILHEFLWSKSVLMSDDEDESLNDQDISEFLDNECKVLSEHVWNLSDEFKDSSDEICCDVSRKNQSDKLNISFHKYWDEFKNLSDDYWHKNSSTECSNAFARKNSSENFSDNKRTYSHDGICLLEDKQVTTNWSQSVDKKKSYLNVAQKVNTSRLRLDKSDRDFSK